MFGQVVIGPPGSGKTTYCHGMGEFMTRLGRQVSVINLDPANDHIPYNAAIDISELITLAEVMDNLKLGPNGGLLYCMEYLEKNIDWLTEKLKKIPKEHYLLLDFPGQVELYTHHNSVRNILAALLKLDHRLAAVHLVDSHYCSDAGKFIAVLLTSLSAMLQVELPHVNILSKADLIRSYGKLAFNLDFYTDVLDLTYLLDQLQVELPHVNILSKADLIRSYGKLAFNLDFYTDVLDLTYLLDQLQDDPIFKKYKKMNAALVEIIQDYSLVSFVALNIKKNESVLRVLQTVDKANGYTFGDTEERNLHSLLSCAIGAEFEYEKIKDIQESYVMDNDDDDDDSDAEKKMDEDES